jgi:lipopolysaccharide biosynthesis glycosyltransferase
MDADTICQENLEYLWSVDCPYICACKTHNSGKKQAAELGIDFYINVDVMVMNLDAMRADNFTEKAFAKQDFNVSLWCNEETLINGNFHDKIKLLPQKYNYAFERSYDEPIQYKDAAIIHFIGKSNKAKMLDYAEDYPLEVWNFNNLKDIKDYVCGKSVAIVGNAKSIFDKNNGAEIDAHDIVMRFNLGVPRNEAAQGSKKDILITARGKENPFIDEFKATFIVKRIKHLAVNTPYFFAKKDRLRMKHNGVWSSSGFYGLNLILSSDPKSIDLYGFDFERTPTYYNAPDFKTEHNFNYEEKYIKDLEEKGKLKIH